MTPVIAFGEALIDMLSSRLGDNTGQETFTPYAGGAPATWRWPAHGSTFPASFWAWWVMIRLGTF